MPSKKDGTKKFSDVIPASQAQIKNLMARVAKLEKAIEKLSDRQYDLALHRGGTNG